jgi:hypothetical protein
MRPSEPIPCINRQPKPHVSPVDVGQSYPTLALIGCAFELRNAE